jgi:hypothetical protein
MLEDLTMDKKSAPGVRANQFPAKQGGSNNNDCKKLQGKFPSIHKVGVVSI